MSDYGILLRQPQPNDIVGDTIPIAALGTAFEAQFVWRLLDGDTVLAEGVVMGGSMGTMSVFVAEAALQDVTHVGPATFEFSADDPSGGEEPGVPPPVRVQVLVVPGATGYVPHQVVQGETLTTIARDFGGGSPVATVRTIATVNHLQDPNKIRVGQLLRVPV